jgi:hypothetical protein
LGRVHEIEENGLISGLLSACGLFDAARALMPGDKLIAHTDGAAGAGVYPKKLRTADSPVSFGTTTIDEKECLTSAALR